jgi:hypothetical protein
MANDETPNYKEVNELRSKNYSDTKIIDDLHHKGLNYTQTYDIMRMADLAKSGSEGMIMDDNKDFKAPGMGKESFPLPPLEPPANANFNSSNVPNPPINNQSSGFYSGQPNFSQSTPMPQNIAPPPGQVAQQEMNVPNHSTNMGITIEEIEEVVETIIDERWKEVSENIKKVVTWKNLMEQRFERMDQDIKNVKENFNELYRAVVGKVGDYDKNLMKVGSELKAMEKVFSQVLPTFTENVNDLARVAEDIKTFAIKDKLKVHKNKD